MNTLTPYFGEAPREVLDRAGRVRLAVFDVDGVLTDGTIRIHGDGESGLVFHIHDGKGLRMLIEHEIAVALITARGGRALQRRCEELGIEHVLQGRSDKGAALDELCERFRIERAECSYAGDDLVDLPALTRAGLGIAVADAHPSVAARSHWCTRRPGGRGAVREIAELILAGHGRLQAAVDAHAV